MHPLVRDVLARTRGGERRKQNVTIIVLTCIAKALKTTPDRLLVPPRNARG
jgi:hypothetical protein